MIINCTGKTGTGRWWAMQVICLMTMLSLVLSPALAETGLWLKDENFKYFKMISTVEYSGKGQFRDQAQVLFTVRKRSLSDDKTLYFISARDFDLTKTRFSSDQQAFSKELSFVINKTTGTLSGGDMGLALLGGINNECVRSLKQVTKNNIGKTWKQSFPNGMRFTLTAVEFKTKTSGKMIAVRALSEPFTFTAAGRAKKAGPVKSDVTTLHLFDSQIEFAAGSRAQKAGPVKSSIAALYLFDSRFENVYLSMVVFEAKTKINGFDEKLRHEVATYRTNLMGFSADLNGLGKKFEKFAQKVRLSDKNLKIVKRASLPQWACAEGLEAAKMANICAALACEGKPNPVILICIAASRTLQLQTAGGLVMLNKPGTVGQFLVKNVPGIGSMKIAVAPFMGVGLGTAAAIGGGTAGAIAAGGGGGGSSHGKAATPVEP